MSVKDLDSLGYPRVVSRCDKEPIRSCTTQGGEVGMARRTWYKRCLLKVTRNPTVLHQVRCT